MLFSHPEFDNHEHLSFFCDPETGLKAIVAIHNTSRGPALGGCRMFPYASDEEALRDVLRLSRGMTYKSALANLDLGGEIIWADKELENESNGELHRLQFTAKLGF